MTPWLQFAAVIIGQLVVFATFVYVKGITWNEALRVLGYGLLVGIPFGIAFDFLIGHELGVFDYRFGFSLPFLVMNGGLSYGIMIATVALFPVNLSKFYLYSVIVGVLYELINFFSPIWSWEFLEGSFVWEELIIILIGYWGLSVLMKITYSPGKAIDMVKERTLFTKK